MKKRLLVILLIISLPVVLACNEERGGIKIEDKCYDCGVADNICPEDFGVECKVVDPDCMVVSSIFVRIVEWFKSLFK